MSLYSKEPKIKLEIDNIKKGNHELVLDHFYAQKDKSVFDELQYAIVMEVCKYKGSVSDAENVFHNATRLQKQSINSINAMICLYVTFNKIHEAETIFHSMVEKFNIVPDTTTFMLMIHGWNRKDEFKKALKYWSMIQETANLIDTCIIREMAYSLTKLDRIHDALSLLAFYQTKESMDLEKVAILYNHSSLASQDSLFNYLLDDPNIEKSVLLFNIRILKSKNKEDAKSIFSYLKRYGVTPNEFTYRNMLHVNGYSYHEAYAIYFDMLSRNITSAHAFQAFFEYVLHLGNETHITSVLKMARERSDELTTISLYKYYVHQNDEINLEDLIPMVLRVDSDYLIYYIVKDLSTKRLYEEILMTILNQAVKLKRAHFISTYFLALYIYAKKDMSKEFCDLYNFCIQNNLHCKNNSSFRNLLGALLHSHLHDYIFEMFRRLDRYDRLYDMNIWNIFLESASRFKNATQFLYIALAAQRAMSWNLLNLETFYKQMITCLRIKSPHLLSDIEVIENSLEEGISYKTIALVSQLLSQVKHDPRWIKLATIN